MAWYDFPVTQAHGVNGEAGVDYGTPFHTPLTALLSGVVQRVVTGIGYGAEVDIASSYQGQPITQTFLHVDVPTVQPGQQVGVGQLIGLSGGQLSGGQNPDTSQYSSGPHTEFDLFRGGPWQNPIDPTQFVANYARGGPGGNPLANVPVLGGLIGAGQTAASDVSGLGSIGPAIAGLPGSVGHGLANAAGAGLTDVSTFFKNQIVALIVALVVAIVLWGGRG